MDNALKVMNKNSNAGFTLIELMISMALLLLIAGVSIGALNSSQKGYRQSEIERSLHQQMRGAIEQMAQEVTQAGLTATGIELNSGVTGVPNNLPTGYAGSLPATVSVKSTLGLFDHENLWVDTGANAEAVTIKAGSITINGFTLDGVSPNTTLLSKPHSSGAVIYPRGVFPGGILWPVPATPANGSTATSLKLFGDINNDGTLDYVQYDCPTTVPGPLVRSAWDMGLKVWISHRVPLINDVTACNFVYTYTADINRTTDASNVVMNAPDDPQKTAPNTPPSARFQLTDQTFPQFVLSVGITITSCSQTNGLVTNVPICLTKSFLNIQPRNVLAAYLQAVEANTPGQHFLLLDLQPTPTALLPTSAP